VGLGMDDQVWDATTFTKNRERLLSGDLAQRFLEEIVAEARSRGLTSDEHFSVDGTMVQAWAGQKSFKKKDGPPEGGSGGGRERDFRGQKRPTTRTSPRRIRRLVCTGRLIARNRS